MTTPAAPAFTATVAIESALHYRDNARDELATVSRALLDARSVLKATKGTKRRAVLSKAVKLLELDVVFAAGLFTEADEDYEIAVKMDLTEGGY